MKIYFVEWGNGGQLWGVIQPSCIFDGLVDGFTEIPVLFCRPLAADIAAVFVIIGFDMPQYFRNSSAQSLSRLRGLMVCDTENTM